MAEFAVVAIRRILAKNCLGGDAKHRARNLVSPTCNSSVAIGLAGANPDFRRLALFCKETDKTENCEHARSGDFPSRPPHDPRIRSAVLADAAMSFAFTPEALAGIKIPLQIWRSELGGGGVNATSTALTASHLPGLPDIHAVPAGHYAFLPPYGFGAVRM
jgi:predicted dienelactone hydrolase